MGQIIIQEETTKYPITLIGKEAGVCWGADTNNNEKNYKRGIECLNSKHGRTFEFPDVYMILDGYSARVIREWYTHIGGLPTRLQASTRYIDYEKGFDYIIPPSIKINKQASNEYIQTIENICNAMKKLKKDGFPTEDIALLLPLGMKTKIVCKHNLRNLVDMSRQRMCARAYWEYRQLFKDLCVALSNYSSEWKYLVDTHFHSKCEEVGYCEETKSCGRFPKKEY